MSFRDRADNRVGMQAGDHQVTGFGGNQCRIGCILVADFADNDNIGPLAHCVAYAFVVGGHIHADFCAVKRSTYCGSSHTDWVFDGNDVRIAGVVDTTHQ